MDRVSRSFGVGPAIVSVALLIIVAALVETRDGNIKEVARKARAADQVAMATAGPAAKRAIAARCHSVLHPMEHGGRGSLDLMFSKEHPETQIHDGATIKGTEHYVLLGWAIDAVDDRLAPGVCLVVDGQVDTRAQVQYGVPRADIASGFGEAVLLSGYRIEVPAGLLTRGKHRIEVSSITDSGVLSLLPAARSVNVRLP
jgi:hypothetical protein